MFHEISFSGFREEVENISANQRLGGHLVFLNGPIYPNLVEDLELLLPVNLQLIPLSGFREELSQNVSANQRPWPPPYFSDQPKNTNFYGGHPVLACY